MGVCILGRWVNASVSRWMEGWMNGKMDGCLDRWMDGCLDRWMDGCLDRWMDGCLDRWMMGEEEKEGRWHIGLCSEEDGQYSKRTWDCNLSRSWQLEFHWNTHFFHAATTLQKSWAVKSVTVWPESSKLSGPFQENFADSWSREMGFLGWMVRVRAAPQNRLPREAVSTLSWRYARGN